MTRKTKILFKVAVAAFLTFCGIYLFAPWEFALYYLRPLPQTVQEEVDAAARNGLDGIIVYVDHKGAAPETYAAGWHDRVAKTPANAGALFKIGSIRKLYDVAALAKLAAAGRISPDDRLTDHLPELRGRIENAGQITLRMMVQHKSGIPNYTDQSDWDWGRGWSREDALALVLDQPADFAPGEGYGYSNTNYLLLRRVMSKVLGYDHGAYIKAEILEPQGLVQTYLSVTEVDQATLMSGYHIGYETDFKTLDQGFVATAGDVAKFVRALNDGTLFTASEREIYAGLYDYGHTGWVLGHSSRAHYHKGMDAVVVQFTNTTGNDTVILTGIVYDRIVEILRGQEALHGAITN